MPKVIFAAPINFTPQDLPAQTTIFLSDEGLQVRIDSYDPQQATCEGYVLQFPAVGSFAQWCTETVPQNGQHYDITMQLSSVQSDHADALFGFALPGPSIFSTI
jgi:hypothetical protein